MARVSFRMPHVRSAAAALAVAVIVVSVLAALIKPLAGLIALVPTLVVGQLFLWQLVTYAFLETSPIGVIFGALILWSLGGAVESMWGRKRFLLFAFGVTALAGVATVLLSLVLPSLVAGAYPGGAVMTGSLWVAFGLQIGRGQTNFWGFPLTGNALALIGAGFVFLNGAFGGLSAIVPSAFALLFTFFYMRGAQPGQLWLRFRGWQLERDLKKRASKLRSIDGGRRNIGGDSDKYLH
jgi:membrane associated rhomboid family serine protease